MSGIPITIIGGGLWGGLMAYTLAKWHPDVSFLLLEKEEKFGGNHTWSFHGSDLDAEGFEFISPFVSKSWPRYEVRFPIYKRCVEGSYHSVKSGRFDEILRERLTPESYCLGVEHQQIPLGAFTIDGRGTSFCISRKGYQKFLGLTLKLRKPHGLTHPILMDARVSQRDGYRFMYYLPWDDHRVLVEDTRYADAPEINASLEADLLEEVTNQGWEIDAILEREVGALPIPLTSAQVPRSQGIVNLSGIFHDTTGYSLPDAVRICLGVKRLRCVNERTLTLLLEEYRRQRAPVRSYFRLMNNLLFRAGPADKRFQMLQHFYTKPEPLIRKFYAGNLSAWDKLRIFSGAPPVPIRSALSVFLERGHANEELE